MSNNSASAASPALFQKHEDMLNKAIEAVHARSFYAAFLEVPSKKVYGENGNEEGLERFQAQLNNGYEGLRQSADAELTSEEQSPYTLEKLGIRYPIRNKPSDYVKVAQGVAKSWGKADVKTRAGILTESLVQISKRFFEMTFATMHTTGQSYMMSFQASGPHSNDRALEAIAMGLHEQTRFPDQVDWVKPMGRDKDGNPMEVKLEKRFINVPFGLSLAIGCSTFPVWNTVPGVYASLITGNPVIVKPHPMAIYPLAIVVEEIQRALQAEGFDANIVQLAADTSKNPIAVKLAENPAIRLIDYTGGSSFGDFQKIPGVRTFTEKAGINSIVLHSTDNVNAMMQNIAFSLSLYSGQMCTCPQNIFIPKDGIDTPEGKLSYEDTVAALTGSIHKLVNHPKMGAGTLGAIQNPATADRIVEAVNLGFKQLLESQQIENPDFPKARIASPAVFEVPAIEHAALAKEMFGPIVFVVPVDDYKAGVAIARDLATKEGAITFSSWCTDADAREYMIEEMAQSFTSIAFNFVGPIWVNQSAGFSDFHVSGGNPAGNASLTDPEYVLGRFEIVGVRVHG